MSTSILQSDFLSIPKQAKRLEERHNAAQTTVTCCGMNLVIDPGVYQTSRDSELMAESVKITNDQSFLEIGCGSGVVSIAIAKKAKQGIGVDINEKAVENSRRNAEAQGVSNVQFLLSNVFDKVVGTFDVVICNPPYTKHAVKDTVERMFWDPDDEMKKQFFKQVTKYLNPEGRVYLGWANFGDIDVDLPFKLAEKNGLRLVSVFTKEHNSDVSFYVLEFVK